MTRRLCVRAQAAADADEGPGEREANEPSAPPLRPSLGSHEQPTGFRLYVEANIDRIHSAPARC